MSPSSHSFSRVGGWLLSSTRHTQTYPHRSLLSLSSCGGGGRAPTTSSSSSSSTTTTTRAFSTSPAKQKDVESYPNEHDPDSASNRFSINTDRGEYSKSGSDNAVAAMSSAWDVNNMTPEGVREASDREARDDGDERVSPLEVSPANQEVSKFTDEDGRAESVVHGPSRRVSPQKGKRVDYGGAAIESPGERDDTSKM